MHSNVDQRFQGNQRTSLGSFTLAVSTAAPSGGLYGSVSTSVATCSPGVLPQQMAYFEICRKYMVYMILKMKYNRKT